MRIEDIAINDVLRQGANSLVDEGAGTIRWVCTMAIASFDALCSGFCDLIKVSTPKLTADDQGLVAFHVTLRGITVNLVQRADADNQNVFVVFELGSIGQGGSNPVAELSALLEANFQLLQSNPPVFSRNPATGDAVLQYVYPLCDATPFGLYELIARGADWITGWREALQDDAAVVTPPLDIFHQIA